MQVATLWRVSNEEGRKRLRLLAPKTVEKIINNDDYRQKGKN